MNIDIGRNILISRSAKARANRDMIIDSSFSDQCRRVVLARCQSASNMEEEEMLMLLHCLDHVLGLGFVYEIMSSSDSNVLGALQKVLSFHGEYLACF